MNKKLKKTTINAAKSLWKSTPIILCVILLISLLISFISQDNISYLFTGGTLDLLIGSLFGSLLAGNPITSYIISGELLKNGVSLIAVTAFLVSWITVGIIQLPAEIAILGKKFAITRNLISFISSIVVAILVVGLVNLL
jgi:uncharacterized membrane protein YraQ (UPF0718 family)